MLAAGSGGGAVGGPPGGRVGPEADGVAPAVVVPALLAALPPLPSFPSGQSRNVSTPATRTSTSPTASASRRPRLDVPFGTGPTGGCSTRDRPVDLATRDPPAGPASPGRAG